jgi:hypothetical protein
MLRLYYKIWADVIAYHKERKGNEISWKPFAIVAVSTLQGINLLALLLLLHSLSGGRYLILFPLHIFNMVGLNTLCSVLLTFFAPFIIINYLLLFYNDRYQEVLKPYHYSKGKLYRNYALISIGIIVIPLLLKVVFF